MPSCFYAVNTALAWSEYAKIVTMFLIFIIAFITIKQTDIKLYFLKGLLIFTLLSLAIASIQMFSVYFDILPSQWIIVIQEWFGDIPTSEDPHQKTYFITQCTTYGQQMTKRVSNLDIFVMTVTRRI